MLLLLFLLLLLLLLMLLLLLLLLLLFLRQMVHKLSHNCSGIPAVFDGVLEHLLLGIEFRAI